MENEKFMEPHPKTGVPSPCHHCPDRQLYCHGSCKKYAEFEASKELERQKRHEESIAPRQHLEQLKGYYKYNA